MAGLDRISGAVIHEARKSRGKTQADLAKLLGRDQSYISRLEKDQLEGGVKGHELLAIAQFLEYDPFVFAGSIELADGDLRRRSDASALSAIHRQLSEINDKVNPRFEEDPVAARVSANSRLRDIVTTIQFLDGRMLERINAVIFGYLQSIRMDEDERETAVGE